VKIVVTDQRYGDRGITVVDNGVPNREEHARDDRWVDVGLDPGELEDLVSEAPHGGGRLRPDRIHLRWHRGDNQYESSAHWYPRFLGYPPDSAGGWCSGDWQLVTCSVGGPNIKASGETGKRYLTASYRQRERPALLQELVDRYDPAHGWPLDDQVI